MPTLPYPATRKVDQVDLYHGTPVADPFRWLEDDLSQETAGWVEQQNVVTFGYLEGIPYREALRERMTTLVNYPRSSAPEQKGPWFLFARNDGLQNQPVYYLQRGEDGGHGVASFSFAARRSKRRTRVRTVPAVMTITASFMI